MFSFFSLENKGSQGLLNSLHPYRNLKMYRILSVAVHITDYLTNYMEQGPSSEGNI
jgi:hypothetical protein